MKSKLWLMAAYEYRRHVLQKRFIFAMLSMPFMIALMIGVVALGAVLEDRAEAVGYVDHAGLLAHPRPAPPRGNLPDDVGSEDLLPLIAYPSEEQARAALDADEIQAYYVISPDYYTSNQVELYFLKEPGSNARRQFWDFVQINRLAALPPEIASRAVAGSDVYAYWLEEDGARGREFSERTFVNSFLPMAIGIALVVLLMSSSGYLMGAVAEEKENRTMEIVITSLSPGQLVAGKVAGIVGVAATQLAGWVAFGLLGVFVGGHYLGIGWLQNVQVDMGALGAMALVSAPAFVLIAALMTAVGATVAEVQEAQQVTGLFVLPLAAPLWLAAVILNNPDGPVAVAFSLLPVTSVGTLALRLGFGTVPGWQIAANAALSTVCAIGALWVAGRAFRIGMLRYGQKLRWGEILGRKGK
jgi:ABC-2 type transport system permease protein